MHGSHALTESRTASAHLRTREDRPIEWRELIPRSTAKIKNGAFAGKNSLAIQFTLRPFLVSQKARWLTLRRK